jgi:hypothetical protein
MEALQWVALTVSGPQPLKGAGSVVGGEVTDGQAVCLPCHGGVSRAGRAPRFCVKLCLFQPPLPNNSDRVLHR